MKSKKKVVKRGKSSKSKRDEWIHEGGVQINEYESNPFSKSTQERDEKYRRSRMKQENAKLQKQFAEKMKRKVAFRDIIRNEFDIEKQSVDESEAPVEFAHRKSLSDADRLQLLLQPSVTVAGNSPKICVENFNIEGDQRDQPKVVHIPSDLVFSNVKFTNSSCVVSNDSNPSFNWFFSSNILSDTELVNEEKHLLDAKTSPTYLSSFRDKFDYKVYGSLHRSIPGFLENLESIADISGIPNMWKKDIPLNNLCKSMLKYLLSYCDTVIEGRDLVSDETCLEMHLIHCMIHIVKSRELVLKNNILLKSVESIDALELDVYRDQGFTRPRLLILCPLRSTVMRIVKLIKVILGENTSFSGLDKFEIDFGESSDDGDENTTTKKEKPLDWHNLFEGNIDDDFKLGIQINPGEGKGNGFTKGAHMRLFSDFYQSDIIIASPIGLKLVVENNDSGGTNDFLSSVEQIFIYQADVLFMQNWDHVEFLMSQINSLPKETRDTDYNRVKPYFLNGHAKYHRQVMMLSHFNNPEFQLFCRKFASSRAGLVRVKRDWDGVVSEVCVPAKQVFQKVSVANTPSDQENVRFRYFTEQILYPLVKQNQSHTLIVAANYFDYVRIRNELLKLEASAVFVSEYSRDSEISRSRARFFQGLKNMMLYCGRAHFFWRYKIRGVKNVIFYSLPEYPHFYSEIVNMIDQNDGASLALYSKFDRMNLDRILGKTRAQQVQDSKKSSFVFF